ncbi:unnamed protein product, partial [Dicrocoelium dendriticum]
MELLVGERKVRVDANVCRGLRRASKVGCSRFRWVQAFVSFIYDDRVDQSASSVGRRGGLVGLQKKLASPEKRPTGPSHCCRPDGALGRCHSPHRTLVHGPRPTKKSRGARPTKECGRPRPTKKSGVLVGN